LDIKSKLKVSFFQIPEDYKTRLNKMAAKSALDGNKKSVNTIILEAIESYLLLGQDSQPKPELKISPVLPYTVRMSEEMKSQIANCAAIWQLNTGFPVTMNAVVNTAISIYLEKNK
jgi:hypothetical protein